MSSMSFLRVVPDAMWDAAFGANRDVEAELERAIDFGVRRQNELAEAHRMLDAHDPDPEIGELLHERLARVLGPHLTAVKEQ